MIIGIGTPTSQSNIPLPMIASICCLWSDNHSGYSQFLTSGGVTLNCFVNSVRLECRSPSQSPAVSANPLFINAYDFLRDVTPIAACHRPNCRNRLSFPKGLHLFRHHASRFGSGQSTAAGYTHQTKCYDALRLQRQHGRLGRYGKPVIPDWERVAHCVFSNWRHRESSPKKTALCGRPFSGASLHIIQRTFFLHLVSRVGRSCRVKCLPTGLSVEGTAIRHFDRRTVQDSLQTRRIGIVHA